MNTDRLRGTLFLHDTISKNNLITHLKIQLKKSLQDCRNVVHGIIFSVKVIVCAERVSLRRSVKKRASVSIEASVVIPIFLFCFLEVASLLNDLNVYSGILYALKTTGDTVSVYGYVLDKLEFSEKELSVGEEVISQLIFKKGYLENKIRKQCSGGIYEQIIQGGSKGIHLSTADIEEDDEAISIAADCVVEPLFSFAGTSMDMTCRYYGRLWTGYEIKSSADNEYVYVAENGRVYHVTDTCSHLSLSVTTVKGSEIEVCRNVSGSKYKPCVLCCTGKETSSYYITKSGERYHTNISCSGLKRTVHRMKKEQAQEEGLHACSRCG